MRLLYICTYTSYDHQDLEHAKDLAHKLGEPLFVAEGGVDMGSYPSAMIPNRNMLLLSLASQMSSHVMMCGVREDLTRDGHRKFYDAAARALSIGQDTKVRVTNPLNWASKPTALRQYMQRIGDPFLPLATRSCYRGGGSQCGACPACVKRYIAFRYAGIIGDTYDRDPLKTIDEMRQQGTWRDAIRLGARYLYQVRSVLA